MRDGGTWSRGQKILAREAREKKGDRKLFLYDLCPIHVHSLLRNAEVPIIPHGFFKDLDAVAADLLCICHSGYNNTSYSSCLRFGKEHGWVIASFSEYPTYVVVFHALLGTKIMTNNEDAIVYISIFLSCRHLLKFYCLKALLPVVRQIFNGFGRLIESQNIDIMVLLKPA